MKKSKFKSLIKEIVTEMYGQPQDMRFDLGDVRIECWVLAEDITDGDYADQYRQIASNNTLELGKKIEALKKIAVLIAEDKIREAGKIVGDITANVGIKDVNVDRINWQELASPPKEEEEI